MSCQKILQTIAKLRRMGWPVYIPLLLAGLLAILLPFVTWLLVQDNFFPSVNFTQTGQIGDTIGGTTAPIVGMIGALLTFIAFWIQYKFNEFQTQKIDQQDEKIAQQEKAIRLDKFENRYYELLRIHRENVSETQIKDTTQGRRAFIAMFDELRFAYHLLRQFHPSRYEFTLTEEDYMNIAFIAFFFGIGKTSDKLAKDVLKKYEPLLIHDYYLELRYLRDKWWESKKENVQTGLGKIEVPSYNRSRDKTIDLEIKYSPFDGHISRLGHYFRHLYHIVQFVHEQPDDLLTKDDKKKYLKTLRAQLSAHEQLLLYYNSLSVLGRPWATDGYLKMYRLIRNIPLPLADFGNKPQDEYSIEDPTYFEWTEIENRIANLG